MLQIVQSHVFASGLSTYTATLYKKFGAAIDPVPILQYVAHRLKCFRSADLIVLRELIAKTTQIQPQANLTDDQVTCMGGGPTIRIEALAPDTRGSLSIPYQAVNRSGTRRLMQGLMKADLALPLLILIAQQREFCIETVDKNEEHLKHISNLYDEVRLGPCVSMIHSLRTTQFQCQAALFQYVEFLLSAFGTEYAGLLPPLEELCNKLKIQPDIAFHIWRPALHGPVLVSVGINAFYICTAVV
jgi:THO complex subunit 2